MGGEYHAVARISKNVHVTARLGTPCHSLVAPSLLTVYELFTKWHDSFVMTSRDALEIIFKRFKILAATRHAPFHLTRIPMHWRRFLLEEGGWWRERDAEGVEGEGNGKGVSPSPAE